MCLVTVSLFLYRSSVFVRYLSAGGLSGVFIDATADRHTVFIGFGGGLVATAVMIFHFIVATGGHQYQAANPKRQYNLAHGLIQHSRW